MTSRQRTKGESGKVKRKLETRERLGKFGTPLRGELYVVLFSTESKGFMCRLELEVNSGLAKFY